MIKVHIVVNSELKEMLVVGGFCAHLTQVPGELTGPSGEPLMTEKVLLHLNCGMKVVIEESMEDLELMCKEKR